MYRTAAMLVCAMLAQPAMADASFEELVKAYESAESRWKESSTSDRFVDYSDHPINQFLPRVRGAITDSGGSARAAEVLIWMLSRYEPVYSSGHPDAVESLTWAVDTVAEHHAADPGVGAALASLKDLAYAVQLDHLTRFYQAILAASSDNEVKAQATFNMAYALYDDFGPLAGKHPLKQILYTRQAKTLFGQMSTEYAGTGAAASAEPFLFEMEHLQVGKKAPDILGTRPDGTEIRLSQFAGQVVVLDFWGFW